MTEIDIRAVRARAWGYLSPEVAAAADMTLQQRHVHPRPRSDPSLGSADGVPMTTGTDVLREALKVFNAKNHLGRMAHDAGVSPEDLEAFMRGTGRLQPPALNALAKHLLDAAFDADADLLRNPHRREATPLGTPPEPYRRRPYVPVDWSTRAPRDVVPKQPAIKKPRPGWA